MKIKSFFTAALAVLCIVFSCTPEVREEASLSADVSTLEAPSGGDALAVVITANCSWYTSAPAWVTVNPSSGKGNRAVEVIFSENTSSEERTGTLAFVYGDYKDGKRSEITLSQKGKAVEPGPGPGTDPEPEPEPENGPKQKAVLVDDSQIILNWSVSDFADVSKDAGRAYTIAVYEDKEATRLIWSWDLADASNPETLLYNWSGNASYKKFTPGFVFSSLNPSTDYYIRITDRTDGSFSTKKYTTTASPLVDVTKKAASSAREGETIVYETFSEFPYGARSPETVPGYSSTTRSSDTAAILPSGTDPVTASSGSLYLVYPDIHMGLFNTMAKLIPSTRLNSWAAYVQNNTAGAMCIESGCLKVGASKYTGDIVTPPLNCLQKTANLRVTFDAAPYISWGATTATDKLGCVVDVFSPDVSLTKTWWVDANDSANVPADTKEVTISSDPQFKTYSVTLENVPVGARIGVGCKRDNTPGSSQHRCYLDNIRIEVIEYPTIEALTELEGTAIASTSDAIGVVRDSKTGKGIAGVPVSDGYKYVTTDANGVYQMKMNSLARKIYLSLPSEYKVPLDAATHLPLFYSPKNVTHGIQNRNDFSLEPLDSPEDKFTLFMIGDPQCRTDAHVKRYVNESVPDMKSTAGKGVYQNVYAMTLGDIIWDSTNEWTNMKNSMSNVSVGSGWLPYFQCIGNHDHTATTTSDYEATARYTGMFGPTDYSFNRGKAHIVAMDNVVCTTPSSNSSPDGATWGYNAGFSDEQIAWLTADLNTVKDKANTLVILCCHIPFRGGATSGGSSVNTDKHYADVLTLLSQFHEAHIMIGHTHYPQNWIHKGYTCKGGSYIYEHIHQAACGAWWAAKSSTTGAPNGYNIYMVEGNSIKDWVNKGTDRDESYQLRVYDGNQTYTGTKGYIYNWFNASNKGGSSSIVAKGNTVLKGCFVVEAWDDDDTYCSVEFWQGGVKVGNFTRLANGSCTNIALASYWFNEKSKNSTSYSSTTASHYWYYKPASGLPASETNWEVRFIRKIPTSGVTHTYTRNSLTTDYSEY